MQGLNFDLIRLPEGYNPESKARVLTSRVPADLYEHIENIKNRLKYESVSEVARVFLEAAFSGDLPLRNPAKVPAGSPVFSELNKLRESDQKKADTIASQAKQIKALQDALQEARQNLHLLTEQAQIQEPIRSVSAERESGVSEPDTQNIRRYVPDTLRSDTNSDTPPYRIGVSGNDTPLIPIHGDPGDTPENYQEQIRILEETISEILDQNYAESDGKLEMTLADLNVVKKALDQKALELGISQENLAKIYGEYEQLRAMYEAGVWALDKTFDWLIDTWRAFYGITLQKSELHRGYQEILIQYPHAVSSGR